LTFTPGLTKNNSYLLHGDRHTVTVLVNEYVGNRQQDAMLPFCVDFNCLMHTVDHFDNEGWFNCY